MSYIAIIKYAIIGLTMGGGGEIIHYLISDHWTK